MERILFSISVIFLTITSSVAQEAPGPISSDTTQTLIYSVNRTPERPFDTARSVKVITSEEIWRKNPRTLGEVLIEEGGVFVQQTNYAYGNPIIRGQTGQQILILVDGVRINNATYRSGPLQYLNTIDINMVERIEIVRGVGSVLGSDALGGTINIITKNGRPGLNKGGIGGEFFGRYSTADSAFTARAEAYGTAESYRYQVGGTYRDTGDVTGGGDIGTQVPTAYDEVAGNLSFDYFLTDTKTLSFDYQLHEQDEVPRTDKYTSERNLVYLFDPQKRQLATVSFEDLAMRGWYESLRLTASWNRQDEGRQEIRTGSPTNQRNLSDSQTVLGLNLEMASSAGWFGIPHALIYGIDYYTEDISSTRVDTDLETGDTTPKRGRFTDGSSYDSAALYVQDRFEAADWLTMVVGLRWVHYSAGGQEESEIGTLDLSSTDTDVAGAINTLFHLSDSTNLAVNFARGYRAPNINDISSYEYRPEGIEVPNPDLDSEVILSYEIGLKYDTRVFSGNVFYFVSDMSNLIARSPGSFMGHDFFDKNGNGIQDPDEPSFIKKKNIGDARINGLELDFSWRPTSTMTLFGNFTSTTGEDETNGTPLSFIPPDFGALGCRWSSQAALRPWAELILLFAGAQRDLSPRDIADSRIGPEGTDGFVMVNLRGGLTVSKAFRCTAAIENLFDEEVKYHASGVYRPGRQLVVGGEVRF